MPFKRFYHGLLHTARPPSCILGSKEILEKYRRPRSRAPAPTNTATREYELGLAFFRRMGWWEVLMMERTQLMTKLQVAVEKRGGARRSSASCFARKGIGYLDELGDAIDLRGRDRHDVEAVGKQGIAAPRIARLLTSLTMEGETVVLRRDTRLRPQKVADHPITPRDAHCLI